MRSGKRASPETIILDVGCGGGLLAEEFARAGFTVKGIDPSWASVRTAREHAATSGLPIRYMAADGGHLPLVNDSCDVVLCCDVLEHVEDPVRPSLHHPVETAPTPHALRAKDKPQPPKEPRPAAIA